MSTPFKVVEIFIVWLFHSVENFLDYHQISFENLKVLDNLETEVNKVFDQLLFENFMLILFFLVLAVEEEYNYGCDWGVADIFSE